VDKEKSPHSLPGERVGGEVGENRGPEKLVEARSDRRRPERPQAPNPSGDRQTTSSPAHLAHAEGLALADHHNRVVDEASSMETVLVCSGKKRPHASKGQWLPTPRLARS
jgi:hypothetical protein